MEQKTIDSKSPESMGIKCYVRCTSNKIDTAKDDVRSINLNFDIRVGDKNVGKGNNLNINNIYPEDYTELCNAFGVDDIREDTPFFAELMTLLKKERQVEWNTAMERKDKKVDKDQADVTRDPELLTEKQEKFINDMIAKDGDLKEEANRYLADLELKKISEFNKEQATTLIKTMKEMLEEKLAPAAKEKPKKEAALNHGILDKEIEKSKKKPAKK